MTNRSAPFRVLIADDELLNRELLAAMMEGLGHETVEATNGIETLALVDDSIDLILLDIMMPGMSGTDVLARLKESDTRRHIPVIMLSALTDMAVIVECIDRGADDYLSKPFNSSLLRARVGACLEKKRLRDQEQHIFHLLEIEHTRAETLLLNILPKPIADRLKESQSTIADNFDNVGVLFADIVDFTSLASRLSATETVQFLNNVFTAIDELAVEFGIEKIKTIGDAYLAVSGLPVPREHHATSMADMALGIRNVCGNFRRDDGSPLQVRIGFHVGPVVAGVIGKNKFIYDLWGDTVNVASRMETMGTAGSIQCTEAAYEILRDGYAFEPPVLLHVKGKGEMRAYRLLGRLS